MSKQRNLNDGNIEQILDRLYTLERQSALAHSSIGREGLEVYDGGWIKILNGGLEVIGSAYITGRLISNGENIFNGTTEINGPTTVAGDLDIVEGGLFRSGSVEIRPDGSAKYGTLEIDPTGKIISGLFELNPDGSAKFGDTTISKEGVVKTGQMELRPDNGGQLSFDNGALTSDSFGTLLNSSTPLQLLSQVGIELSSPRITMLSLPTAPNGAVANVYVDPTGKIHRTA